MPLVLGIESSCDETSAAVVHDGKLLSNIIHTQIPLHRRFGGVVPEIASRNHVVAILPVIQEALNSAGVGLSDLTAICATRGPGLIGSLLVGHVSAKALAAACAIPCLGINHLEGHLLSPRIEHPALAFPFVALLASGGNTVLVHVKDFADYAILGATVDDSAGEAFDKVAKFLGLPYPGGAAIDKLAQQGNPARFAFPRPMLHSKDLKFSFSGLKTSVVQLIKQIADLETAKADIAASFQSAVVDILLRKLQTAVQMTNVGQVAIVGGVAANSFLRQRLQDLSQTLGVETFSPSLRLCTDNAGMIAYVGHEYLARAITPPAIQLTSAQLGLAPSFSR